MKAYIHYEGIQRIDKFLFPPEALREAVTNAIVHKDYASANPIQISVYDDKIIIWNSARISEELPIERLLGKHPSIPYNPLLAMAFFRAGLIEAWGRGIEKMKTECRIANSPEPEVKYDFGGVMITFSGDVPSEQKTFTPQSLGSSDKTVVNTTLKTTLKTTFKVLEAVKNNPYITVKEMTEIMPEISEDRIKYHLRKLKKKAVIQRIGANKGGHWIINETEVSKLNYSVNSSDTGEESSQKSSEKSSLKTSQKSSLKSSLKSSEKILEYMKDNPKITTKELALEIGITERAVKKQVSLLKKRGDISRIGTDKSGYWEVVERE